MLFLRQVPYLIGAALLAACQTTGGYPPNVTELATNADGVWQGVIPCYPGRSIDKRSPKLKIEGNTAWLTNYGEHGVTYEETIENGVVSYKNTYPHGDVRVSATLLTNGDAYISGKRGPNTCYGVISRLAEVAVNDFGVIFDPEKVQACTPADDAEEFVPTRENLLRQSKLRKIRDVTIVSRDRFGIFVVYIDKHQNTLGFMLDNLVSKTSDNRKQTRDWSVGKVRYNNNQYCRTWNQWLTGKEENCWQVHKSEKDQLYFVCPDTGTFDGEANTVLRGNPFNAKLVGRDDCSSLEYNKQKNDKGCSVVFDDIKVSF